MTQVVVAPATARVAGVPLVVIAVLSFALGMYRVDWPGTWPDEGYSLLEATGQAGDVNRALYVPAHLDPHVATFQPADIWQNSSALNAIRATAFFDSGNGAAYAVLLHGWVEAFGPANLAVRMPSVLALVGTAVMVYLLVALATPMWQSAFLAGALTALSPMLIRASKIARPNAVAAFLAVCSMYFLFRLVQGHAKRPVVDAIALGVSSALAVFTHYFAGFVIVGELLFVAGAWARHAGRVRLLSHLVVAALVGAAISVLFLAAGVWDGMQRARATERARVESAQLALDAAKEDPRFETILATRAEVTKQLRLLIANLFLIRSAAADTPWLQRRAMFAGLVVWTLATCIVYVAGFISGWRVVGPMERSLTSLALCVAIAGIVCVLFASIVLMKTIIPFMTRSNVALVPSAMLVTALAARGTLTWRPALKYAALAVLVGQALVFNAVTLRGVFLLRYADPSYAQPTGTVQTASRAKALYRPGDVVEYQRWDDAAKVNVYLRGVDLRQHVTADYLADPAAVPNPPREIVLRRATGDTVILWRGWQDNGALGRYDPQ